jgi:hypothetical protein
MVLRDHEELSPWPNLLWLGAFALLPKSLETIKIHNISPAHPEGINITLSWDTGSCLCTKVFKDTNFAFVFYANRWQLIGKTLLEAGNMDIR